MQESKLLGTLLPAHPDIQPILWTIRQKYGIPDVIPGDDSSREYSLSGDIIDWNAVREELDFRIRFESNMIPPEVARIQMMVEARKKLPEFLTYSEPITPKLKEDVDMLYKQYLQLYDFLVMNLATPFQIAVDGFYSAAIDGLFEYLKTTRMPAIPTDWISSIHTLPFFGEDVIMVLASSLADPDDIAQKFKEYFAKEFGSRRPKITNKNLRYADYLRMWLEGMTVQDIADVDIQLHRLEYPADEESDEYKRRKKQNENRIEHGVKRLWNTFGRRIPDKRE